MSDEFAALKTAPWIDEYVVERYDSGEESLLIYGSWDLTYYVDAEIRFTGVDYMSLPTYFHDAVFRAATDEEVAELRKTAEWSDGSRGFCVVTDATWSERAHRHFVVAQAVRVAVQQRKRSEL